MIATRRARLVAQAVGQPATERDLRTELGQAAAGWSARRLVEIDIVLRLLQVHRTGGQARGAARPSAFDWPPSRRREIRRDVLRRPGAASTVRTVLEEIAAVVSSGLPAASVSEAEAMTWS